MMQDKKIFADRIRLNRWRWLEAGNTTLTDPLRPVHSPATMFVSPGKVMLVLET